MFMPGWLAFPADQSRHPWLASPQARCHVVPKVAAAPVQVGYMTDEERATLAKQWGFTRLPKELPDHVTLNDVVKSMPPEVRSLGRTPLLAGCAMMSWCSFLVVVEA